jgi:hypothetical protein
VFQILFRYNRDFLQNSNGPVNAGFDFQRLSIIELPKVVTINKNLPYPTLLLHVSKVTYLGNKIQMLNDFSNATRFMVPRHDAQRSAALRSAGNEAPLLELLFIYLLMLYFLI